MMDYIIVAFGCVILGWILVLLSDVFLINLGDWKTKKKVASAFKDEIQRNVDMMVPILQSIWESPENIYEFRREVYETNLAQLPILGTELSSDIRSWYDITDIKYKTLKHPADKNLKEKLIFLHERRWGSEIANEWERLQKEGSEIVTKLDDL
jgi:hypothetical protein